MTMIEGLRYHKAVSLIINEAQRSAVVTMGYVVKCPKFEVARVGFQTKCCNAFSHS